MLASTKNQLGNCKNPYQGDTRKVLTVCSAGILRSPTLADHLVKKYGFNVRACGAIAEFALVPISQALVHWAEEIVFVDSVSYQAVEENDSFKKFSVGKSICILDISDVYNYGDVSLLAEIEEQYPDKGTWFKQTST